MHVQRGLLQVEGCAGARDRLDLRLLRRFSRGRPATMARSEEHTSELQSRLHLVCRLLLEKKKKEPRRNPDNLTNRHNRADRSTKRPPARASESHSICVWLRDAVVRSLRRRCDAPP